MSKPIKTFIKRLLAISLAGVLFLFCSCSKQNTADTNNSTGDASNSAGNSNIENISQETKEELQSGSVLTIPYDVEDYVENAIIVSKNDGLLYGVLNNKGETVIPVRYDEIEIMNKTQYIDGTNEETFLLARLEDTNTVFDLQGNKVLVSKNTIKMIHLGIPERFTTKTPVFKEEYVSPSFDYCYKLYNSNGGYLCTLSSLGELICINSYYYMLIEQIIGNGSKICKYDGTEIHTYPTNLEFKSIYSDGDNNKWSIAVTDKQSGEDFIYTYNETGEKISEEKVEGQLHNAWNNHSAQYSNKTYKIYQSNSTWKLEDLNGTPLYLDRYFKNLGIEGKHSCHLLTNEDDSICVFGSRGNKYIDFGVLEGSDHDSIYMLGMTGREKVDALYEGKSSIILVFKSSDQSKIMFYS